MASTFWLGWSCPHSAPFTPAFWPLPFSIAVLPPPLPSLPLWVGVLIPSVSPGPPAPSLPFQFRELNVCGATRGGDCAVPCVSFPFPPLPRRAPSLTPALQASPTNCSLLCPRHPSRCWGHGHERDELVLLPQVLRVPSLSLPSSVTHPSLTPQHPPAALSCLPRPLWLPGRWGRAGQAAAGTADACGPTDHPEGPCAPGPRPRAADRPDVSD